MIGALPSCLSRLDVGAAAGEMSNRVWMCG